MNAKSTQAAHRQLLQQASLRNGSAASGPLASSFRLPGYPPRPGSSDGTLPAVEMRVQGTSSRSGSTALPTPMQNLPYSAKKSRSASLSNALRSPGPRAASPRSARASARSPRSWRASPAASLAGSGGDSDWSSGRSEDGLAEDLEDLDGLCRRLNMRTEEETYRALSGTSTSASTTARCGSSAGEATAEDEPPEDAEAARAALSANPFDTLSGAQRAHYELQSCVLPHGCRIESSPGSRSQFFFEVDVCEGPYTPATLAFWVKIFDDFPDQGSYSVRSVKRIFHPGIDVETGHVHMDEASIRAASGSQLLAVLTSIRQLLLVPADAPALHATAAALLRTDPEEFRRAVRLTLNGGERNGVRYDRVLALGKSNSTASTGLGPAVAPDIAGRERRPIPDAVKVNMMKLEVMRDQFKAQASAVQKLNLDEIRELEA